MPTFVNPAANVQFAPGAAVEDAAEHETLKECLAARFVELVPLSR
jgi:hypothetical protein